MKKEPEKELHQPLVEAMERYLQEGVYPLHTPGHKGGRGMAEPLRSLLGDAALKMDVSLMAELDDIHAPSGCIAAAQQAAAELYGSDAAFLAVNGTTGAIHAMLMTALRPGDKVLVPRNSHRSVAGGLILADAVPVYAAPPYLPEWGLQGQLTPDQAAQAFGRHPDLKAVVLTSPNYFGMAADVRAIADIAHAHGAVLLVDEAHGPHLGFHGGLPPSALQCGADMAAQSTHKLLGAMTQCSLLHVRGERIDLRHAADVMSLLTTTSPNYLLMGSLDAARAQLAADGRGMMSRALAAADRLRESLTGLAGLRVLWEADVAGRAGVTALDRTKVTLHLDRTDVTGIELGGRLREAGLAVELVDSRHVLFLVTYADAGAEWPAVCGRIRGVLEALPAWQGAAAAGPAADRSGPAAAPGLLRRNGTGAAGPCGRAYLRGNGQFLPAGDSRGLAGGTVYGTNHRMVQSAQSGRPACERPRRHDARHGARPAGTAGRRALRSYTCNKAISLHWKAWTAAAKRRSSGVWPMRSRIAAYPRSARGSPAARRRRSASAASSWIRTSP